MAVFLENFVSLRKLYPRLSERAPSNRLAVAAPADATERDYRDLLSEANLNYFHREYSIALQNYLELRHLILTQSHPEMPSTPGLGLVFEIDPSVIQLDRLFEYSRRMATPLGRLPIDPRSVFSLEEIRPNPALEPVRDIGISGGGREVSGTGLRVRDGTRFALGGSEISPGQWCDPIVTMDHATSEITSAFLLPEKGTMIWNLQGQSGTKGGVEHFELARG